MTGNLITTTPKISMHPLAFQGIMVYTCYSQLRDMLLRKFGDEYVLLFARPAENEADGMIDWYTPVQGTAKKLLDLPYEEREPICGKIALMAKEILKYAEELIASSDPLRVTRGNILKLALQYPDDDALFIVGEQPVYTCWGFGPGTPGVDGKNLTRIFVAPPPPVEEPVYSEQPAYAEPAYYEAAPDVVYVERTRWLWWLLPIFLLLLLLALLFTQFGPIKPVSGITLIELPELPFLAAREKSPELASLEKELPGLRSQVENLVAQCKAVPQSKAEAMPLPQVEEKPRWKRGRANTQTPVEPPKKEPELVIPKNAKDATFMEGTWLCETGLLNSRTNEPVKLSFDFDRQGKGKGITYENNDICEGNASARMRNNTLYIVLDEQKCKKSRSSYNPVKIECQDSGANTRCHGMNEDGSTWNAEFRKVR